MTTILIATLVIWTVFGMFVLFSLPDDLSIKSVSLLKLVMALGPCYCFGRGNWSRYVQGSGQDHYLAQS